MQAIAGLVLRSEREKKPMSKIDIELTLVVDDTIFRKGYIVKIEFNDETPPIRGRITNIDTNRDEIVIELDISRQYHKDERIIYTSNIKEIHQIFPDEDC